MPITIGKNIDSLRAQRYLSNASDSLGAGYGRLSSGLRINSASDDAAGLAIASSLNVKSRVSTTGLRNFNDGISLLSIAEGALNELTNITTRLVELAEQAANGSYNNKQRSSLDKEAQALKDEYLRIVQSTEFNGRKVLTAELGELRLQGGFGVEGGIASTLGGAVGTGGIASVTFTASIAATSSNAAGDLNGDGILDFVTASGAGGGAQVLIGNGDGTFKANAAIATDIFKINDLGTADINNDGILDLALADENGDRIRIYLGVGDGSFTLKGNYAAGNGPQDLAFADFNGDNNIDIVSNNSKGTGVSVLLGQGDGSFVASSTSLGNSSGEVETGDFNGDGRMDFAVNGGSQVDVFLNNGGTGMFSGPASYALGTAGDGLLAVDLNRDGYEDLVTNTSAGVRVLMNNRDGGFASEQFYATTSSSPADLATGDFNGDGLPDIAVGSRSLGEGLNILLGDGSGRLSMGAYDATYRAIGLVSGDFDGDGVLDIVASEFSYPTVAFSKGQSTSGTAPLLTFSLLSMADSRQALPMLQKKLEHLSNQKGSIGAFQQRINTGLRVLQATQENYKTAESRILDVDVAQEAASLARITILQQAATAILVSANQQPALALTLLQR